MRTLIPATCLAATLWAVTAQACKPGSTSWFGTFATVDLALIALQSSYVGASDRLDVEFGGALVRANGRIETTVSCSRRDAIHIVVPPATTALWHTHGRRSSISEYFSTSDFEVVQQTRVPFFLLLPGSVRVLNTDDKAVTRRVPRSLVRLTGHLGRPYAISAPR